MSIINFKRDLVRLLFISALPVISSGLFSRAEATPQDPLYEFRPAQEPMHGLPFLAPSGPKVGVALSGGGSRGMAHIGTLMALEEAGLKPSYIAGVSSGAVIGGLYAAGYSPTELAELTREIEWQDLFTDLPERTNLFLPQKEERATYTLQVRFAGWKPILPTSYLTGQRVSALFSELTFKGDYWAAGDFDNLKVPFRAVSTDLLTGDRIVLDKGTLSEALMASSAVPILLAAVRRGDQLLVDGGLVDAIPVGVIEEMGADLIVASDVSAALRPASYLDNPLDVIDQVMSITMRGPNALSLARADLVIAPDLPEHFSSDFEGIDTLITVGYEEARRAIAQWEGRPEARHLILQAGVHAEHGAALRITGAEVEGGTPVQQERALTYLEHELVGRSADPVGLDAATTRLMNDGSLLDVRMQVFAAPGGAPGQERPVILRVFLYSRPLLQEVRFEGARLYDPPELRRAIGSVRGEPLDRLQVAEDIRSLERYHRDRGYPMALVRGVRFDDRTGILTFQLDEGRINEIRIEGLEQTRDIVILRELPFTVGEPFGRHSVQQIIEDIYSTGLFERVSMQPARTAGGGLAVVIKVEERQRHLARIGLHYLEEQKTEAFLEYRNENLLGMGGNMSIRGLTGSRRHQLGMETRIDRVFRTYMTYMLSAGYSREEIYTYSGQNRTGTYEEKRYHLSVAIGQQVRRLGQVSLGLKAENISVSTLEGFFPADASHQIREFELRTVVDTMDRTPFATRGVRHEFIYETAIDALASDISYVKMLLSMESYHTAGRHTLHPRLFFGTADNTLPHVLWFRLGGLDSFYGYARDQVRGRQVLLISGEYRFQIPWRAVAPLLISARYDWGGAWEEADQVAFKDMISGFGIKASLDSPLGPLEVAYGVREGGYGKFYIGLGFHF